MLELNLVKLGLAVLLIMVINRFFRKRDAATPKERGAITPGRPVDHKFDWEDYWQECGDGAMKTFNEDMDRDREEFIARMNDNRYRLMNDHHH